MRTNIDIDDALMKDALAATGAATKREVVEQGLAALIRLRRQGDALDSIRGTGWVGDAPRLTVLADSSVLIDWLNGKDTLQARKLREFASASLLRVGDLMIAEVLQGCDSDPQFAKVLFALTAFETMSIATPMVAVEAARNYRHLRSKGITIRKTVDTLIATRCILDDLPLLFSDRDFQPFVDHLGLRDAMAEVM